MSANSWREMTETVAPDVRHCAKDKYVCPPHKLTTTKSGDLGGTPPPAFYLFFLLTGHI